MGGTALGASGRSNNGLKLDVKTGKLSLWRLFPTFTFTFLDSSRLPPAVPSPSPPCAFLCCRDNQIGFVRLQNRTNVLLSRAKEGMFIIGNSECLVNSKQPGIWPQVGGPEPHLLGLDSRFNSYVDASASAGRLDPPSCRPPLPPAGGGHV